jgi:hypothetical protein
MVSWPTAWKWSDHPCPHLRWCLHRGPASILGLDEDDSLEEAEEAWAEEEKEITEAVDKEVIVSRQTMVV